MNKAKVIEALNMTIAGLTILRDEIEADGGKAVKSAPAKEEKSNIIPAPVKPVVEEDSSETVTGRFSKEDLDAMKYNDLKKLGASLGVKCTGTRDQITERILAIDVEVEKEPDSAPSEEPAQEEAPVEKKKKLGKKVKDEEPEEQVDEEYLTYAKELSEEMSADEIKEALEEAGVSVKSKKKDVLVKELAKALSEGLIEVEDDSEDDAEESGSEEPESEEDAEVHASVWYEDLDPRGYNDPNKMTDARAKACLEIATSALDQIKNGDTEYDDVVEYINTYATDEEIEAMGEDPNELVVTAMFLELLKRTVDDDGEVHDPSDPYEITLGKEELNMCCGHELKYDKNTNNYICEVCGEEYEAE